jgi:two-component system CheB/CheR fusion protein
MATKNSNSPEKPAARPEKSASKTVAQAPGADAKARHGTAKGGKSVTAKKPATTKAATHPETTPGVPSFPIVGVGASAGGLETFSQLLQELPPDAGMAYVLIQHLAPKHESMLTSLLTRTTPMPVVEAIDGLAVEPNHVYVIPPNTNLGILQGILHLMPRGDPHKQHLPIDYFLRSLSEDQGARAIGVILSGTASDGALGLKAVKAEGGITLAQDPESAKYDGMPRSAIATGGVDFILPTDGIAKELARIAGHPYVARAAARPELPPEAVNELSKIFLLLRSHTGNDFTYYKQSTIQRRIKRRMLLHKLERLKDYVRLLQQTPGELDALFQDMLINVTGFFRDPETFEALKKTVFPHIMTGYSPDNPIRIWAAGCSSGEEAYSVAIALLEFLGDHATGTSIQIFATDIDVNAIEKARTGVYPENIAADLTPARLRRFFVPVSEGYQIGKTIRDMCVFAVQNVIKDPPFSRLDLAICRNLLIYLGNVLQKKVLQVLHYALKPTGFLMLGTSETVGNSADLFALADRKNKIYTKKTALIPPYSGFAADMPGMLETEGVAAPPPSASIDIPRQADRIILNRYAPPGVIIDYHMNIQHFCGQAGPYIEPAPGTATLNLIKMARRDLTVDLRTVVHKAIKEGSSARKEGVKMRTDGESRTVDIQVIPLQGPAAAVSHFLVLFEKPSPPVPAPETVQGKKPPAKAASSELEGRVQELEDELVSDKKYLQSIIEEQEATNEELSSANEEIQSANEELQSTNEELETAKEELQSINEELATVNEELENRNLELTQANSDLTNLLSSIDLPMVILSEDLRIRRFTPPAQRLLNLIASDVGRPISDIKPKLDLPDLGKLALEVIDALSPKTVEVGDSEGHCYSLRLRPYKTVDNRVAGAVLVCIDITEAKDLEQDRLLATVVRHSNDAITVQDLDGRILAWNPRAQQLYGYTEAEALAMNIMEIIPKDRRQEAKDFVRRLRRGESVESFETQRICKEGRVLDVWLTASLLVDDAGSPKGVATTEREMTRR